MELPADLSIESSLLYGVLYSSESYSTARDVGVRPEHFYTVHHQRIAEACWSLYGETSRLDEALVRHELDRRGLLENGTRQALAAIASPSLPPAMSLAGKFAGIVVELAQRRQLIHLAADVSNRAMRGDEVGPAIVALTAAHATRTADLQLLQPVDWAVLFNRDRTGEDWLVDDLWPRGRMISITAPYKGRKSLLMLYLAACLAAGRCPWTNRPRPTVRVVYLDFEMTEDDLLERVEDMGFAPTQLVDLRYFLRPAMPLLDRPEGGKVLLGLLADHEARALIIDTFSRVVASADYTGHEVREFYRWSAQHVKAADVSVARLDHTGHQNRDRAIGPSAKGADVDVGWVIHPADDNGLTLRHHGLSRIRWVPDQLDLLVTDDPLAFRRAQRLWIAGTADTAQDMDELGLAVDVSAAEAQRLLRAAGKGSRRQVVQHAVAYRKERLP